MGVCITACASPAITQTGEKAGVGAWGQQLQLGGARTRYRSSKRGPGQAPCPPPSPQGPPCPPWLERLRSSTTAPPSLLALLCSVPPWTLTTGDSPPPPKRSLKDDGAGGGGLRVGQQQRKPPLPNSSSSGSSPATIYRGRKHAFEVIFDLQFKLQEFSRLVQSCSRHAVEAVNGRRRDDTSSEEFVKARNCVSIVGSQPSRTHPQGHDGGPSRTRDGVAVEVADEM